MEKITAVIFSIRSTCPVGSVMCSVSNCYTSTVLYYLSGFLSFPELCSLYTKIVF